MRKMRWDQKCACFFGMTLVWSASASRRPGPQMRGFWRISAARVCRAVRRQGSSLTRARVQLAFANYTCSSRAERHCGPSPSAMAGGEDVVGVIAWLYEILTPQSQLSRVPVLIKNRAGGESEGEEELGASPHHPVCNDFNLCPPPVSI